MSVSVCGPWRGSLGAGGRGVELSGGVASGPVVPVGSAHLACLPVTSHPLQGLRGRSNVCDAGRPVRRTKKLGRRSAVSGPVPPRESRRRRERRRWRRGVRPGCAHPRRVRGGRRLREMAHGGPESVVCIAGPVGRCRTRRSGAVPGSWRSHGSATGAAPLASVTSTAGGLRRTVPGLPADRRTPDAVRSGVRVRSARERMAPGERWCPLRSGGGIRRARVSACQGDR